MGRKFLGALLILGALTACGDKSTKQERKQAPTSPQDVGVLVETQDAATIEMILAAHPKAQVRRIHPNQGIYEIFNLEIEKVRELAPSADVSLNRFFEFKKFAVPGPAGLEVEGLAKCKAASQFPTAITSVLEPSHTQGPTVTIEVGQKIKLSGTRSQAHVLHPSPLKMAFVVLPAPNSGLSPQVHLQSEFEFTPQTLGVFKIFLVAQDNRDVCSLDGVQVLVTANRPFQLTTSNKPLDLNAFQHLKAVSAQESWKMSQGEGQLIAVIDTGVNYNHPLLASNIALNAGEVMGSDKDNDKNGFVGDVLGYDFVNSDPYPYDDDGHGTHVAGLAAGLQFGMAQKAKILAVKAMTSVGGDAGSLAAAIHYAADRGARIINLSLGTIANAPHPLLAKAIDYAEKKGALIVAAAGNGDPYSGLGFDIDALSVYPASLKNEAILSVGASTSNDVLAPYSNFGAVGVDVVAPGGIGKTDALLSTAHENPAQDELVGMSGTSMAAPIVAGIAAQVWAFEPRLTAREVKGILIYAGKEVSELKAVTVSGRHIDAKSALEGIHSTGVLF